MISILLPLLILSVAAPADTESSLPHAVEVQRWTFEAADDQNYDQWPDGWIRRKGTGYPVYLPVQIVNDEQPRPDSQCALRLQLDGGAALVYSPLIEISPLYSYVLNGHARTSGLKHDVASAMVLFYDQDQKLVETHESRPLQRADSWTPFQIGPVIPSSDQVRWASIALHLRPGAEADLNGAALFDDLWFGKLPRVSLGTTGGRLIFNDPSDVQVTCQVSGIAQSQPTVLFELLDVHGNRLVEQRQTMQPDDTLHQQDSAFSGVAHWHPPIPDYGYYEVRAALVGQTDQPIVVGLAVLQPLALGQRGEFGWSIPRGDETVSLKKLAGLLGEVGIHWVKFPVWYDDKQMGRADELAWFAERLGAQHIQMIGMLDQPPVEVRQLFGEKHHLPVATVFVEPELWHPAVDPVLTRLSLKVRWWQLGGDDDTSFVNFPQLEERIGEIRKEFNRFGQQINLGIPWRSIDETPRAKNPPWSFLSYVAKPALTPQELTTYLSRDPIRQAKRWQIIEPLAESDYDLETRASDLIERMLVAKMQNLDGIFIPDPFDPQHGLLHADGTPDRLLLPWRTTALLISGTQYLGSIQLPQGSTNHIFARDDEAVMVVWNDQPVTETIYLGENVQQFDLWGRRTTPKLMHADGTTQQQIEVQRVPTFVTGLHPGIARWRMEFRFTQDRIASIFGQEQRVQYTFRNVFNQGVGGTVKFHTPEAWEVGAKAAHFKLAAGEQHLDGFPVSLQPGTNSGNQPLQVDFEITADRSYRFSVYSGLQIGLGDIRVELTSRLDEVGNLVIEEQLINTTERFVSFNCLLSTRLRRRERRQVFNLGQGATTLEFVFPNGKELLGETFWLRAEEIDGVRILNHQIIAHE